jgi:Multiubiquitin
MSTAAAASRAGDDRQGHDSHKEVTIIVNGREKKVPKEELSFDEIVALANLPSDPNTIFTVTYRRAQGNKEGTLVEGETVKVKEGTIFNVTPTNKS